MPDSKLTIGVKVDNTLKPLLEKCVDQRVEPDTRHLEQNRSEILQLLRFVEQRVKDAQDNEALYGDMDSLTCFLNGWQVCGGTLQEHAEFDLNDKDDWCYDDDGAFLRALKNMLNNDQ